MKVLVTGGAGYIGSTTAKALEAAGHTPVILDSLLTGPRAFVKDRAFYEGDIADRALLRRIVDEHPDLDCTIHMAARIVVPESVAQPVLYYRDNVAKSLELFDELVALGKPRVVFSSSASLYATVDDFEVDEQSPLDPPSPYARTKRMVEQILEDMAEATEPARADPALLQPDRLRPGPGVRRLRARALARARPAGPGRHRPARRVRDDRHRPPDQGRHRRPRLPARLGPRPGARRAPWSGSTTRSRPRSARRAASINIGTGEGVTVRELLSTFEQVFGRAVPTVEAPPRPGDAVGAYANVDEGAETSCSGRSS